jgi:hypothetical protein
VINAKMLTEMKDTSLKRPITTVKAPTALKVTKSEKQLYGVGN